MKLGKFFFGIVVVAITVGCGVSQSDYDKVMVENEKLKTELDECEFGAEKLVARVEKAYAAKKYELARQIIEDLYEKHPESPKNNEFKKLLKTIAKEELKEKQKKETAEKERLRKANFNNTGIWSVKYFVDNFGEPTKDSYITNTNLIRGTFSNSATQNSKLDVKFLIPSSSRISIMLYEYAGSNPVKAYSSTWYEVFIQDKNKTRIRIFAENTSDRLLFDKIDSRKIHNVLLKGGTVKFRIVENSITNYEFAIKRADFYNNAFRKLQQK